MTTQSPVINRWINKGLKQGKDWDYIQNAIWRPLTIGPGAGGEREIQENKNVFRTLEGTLFTFGALFTSPKCGIRLESWDFSSRQAYRPEIYSFAGALAPNELGYTGSHGATKILAGIPRRVYVVALIKEWTWQDWTKLYLFNMDDADQFCLGYGFVGAKLLTKPAREVPP